jgi:Family of unknown function (DUF6190)
MPADGLLEFVDASVFMGMNSTDEDVRAACVSLFAERVSGRLTMSWEQVGRCDDIVWGYPRHVQDAYYPFMDNLHTDVRVDRLPYDEQDLAAAGDADRLPAPDRLLLAMVANRGGVLYTLNPRLLASRRAPVRRPETPTGGRTAFPDRLEQLYQESLVLRIGKVTW